MLFTSLLLRGRSRPVSLQILLDSPNSRERLLSPPLYRAGNRRAARTWAQTHIVTLALWGALWSPVAKAPVLGPLPRAPHPRAPPVPVFCLLPARPARRPSWSSCPSSAPRRTGNRYTSPRAMPPSTAGAPLNSIVKVGLAPTLFRAGLWLCFSSPRPGAAPH